MDNSGYSKVLDRTPRIRQKCIVLDSTGYSKVLHSSIGDPITNTHWVDSWSHDEKTTDQVGHLVANYGQQLKT